MAGFKTEIFKGIRPRVSALKLPEGEAVTSANTKLGSGDLEPWLDRVVDQAVDDTFNNKTIYLFDNAGIPEWFEWSNFVSVARGSVKGDSLERTYYTGDGFPKMTYRTIATSGSGPYPTAFRKLGIPAPAQAATALGSPLPETLSPGARRVIAGTLITKAYEIAFVNWTVFPGTGSATAEWIRPVGLFTGDIHFDLNVGSTAKVLEVVNKDTVLLGSATGTGAFAETATNDNDTGNVNFELMDNVGSTQIAEWIGWRIPDGISATISDHLLRVGDVIRVTRLDYPQGLILTIPPSTLSFFEQNWPTEGIVTIDGVTFTQTVNATVGADVAGEANFPALKGSFFYEVVRDASDSDILEDRTYIYTFVSNLGEEGPPSPASGVVKALDGDAIEITGFEAPPLENFEIATIRLYRTSSTIAGTEFQFVKEFDVAASTTENVKQADLGEIIETTTWEPPPIGLSGITAMPNGMLVGFDGKNVHFSEPFFPHAWPPEYDQAVDYEIIGLAAFGNNVVVLTEGTPYVLAGAHPRNVNIRPYKINQACVSAESIASNVDKVIYASPDGLVEIGINGARLVTEPYVLKDEWAAFVPTSMVGEFHDGKYFGFFDGTTNVPQAPAGVTTGGDTHTEVSIQAGADEITLTLNGDTWVAVGATFNAQRQNIINGLVAPTNFITGWNLTVLPNIAVGEVVRTSDTVVTITLAARAGYSITDAESIVPTTPATAVVGAAQYVGLPFIITPLQDFSSKAIAFTEFDSGALDVPFAVSSQLDITDWDARGGMGFSFKEEVSISAAAYSPALDRWLAVGFNSGAATPPDVVAFTTSDDDGVTWTPRTQVFSLLTDTAVIPRAAIWDPNHDVFVVGGENRHLQSSPDGEQWTAVPIDLLIPDSANIREFVLSTAGVTDHIYGIIAQSLFLIRSPDLKLAPVTNTWTSIPITYVSALGSKKMASGASAIISIGAFNTDMEIARTVQGATSGASVGAISTYNCTGLTFGADLWVAVSNDFRIVTCASGDEGTIGNWSTPSTTKAAGVNIKGIVFDQGDGVTQGYGFIAFGEITASSLGVVYTSPDAVTWTLRHTMVETVDVDTVAVKFPEDQLGDALTAYAPTFNGAQSPTLLGDSFAEYLGVGGVGSARADTNVTVEVTATDAILRISGAQKGFLSDVGGSFEQADTIIFNLNTVPDSVRITLTDLDISESSTVFQVAPGLPEFIGGWVNPIFGVSPFPDPYGPGEFIDDQFFSPVAGFEYGYQATGTIANFLIFTPLTSTSAATMIITFTFRKEGFDDLSVSYKLRGKATATAA